MDIGFTQSFPTSIAQILELPFMLLNLILLVLSESLKKAKRTSNLPE
jgi:hypothetical protein